MRHRLAVAAAVLALVACAGKDGAPPAGAVPAAESGGPPPTFVNRVWEVAASTSVQPGAFYVFLADGTLVISSPGGRPALGSWRFEDEALVMIEESIPYQTEILELTDRTFRLRIHDPGSGVEITFVPAEG